MNSEQGDDTPLKYLVDALLRYRAVAAILFGGCILIGILYLQIAPRSYTVSMAVTSASQNSVQSPLSNGLQLLGVAPISDQVTLFAEYLEGLHSTETASALLRNQPLMRRIFASEWSDTKGWTEPSSLAKSVKKAIKSALGFPQEQWAPPNARRVADFLGSSVVVDRDMKNPVVTISTTMADRGLALEVLNATHSASDNVLRHQALARTSSYIEYLSGRLQLATGVEYRQAIADSIVEQEKVRMKAASVLPFSAEIFARPTVSLLPTAPNASKVLMISALIGVLMGVVGAVFCQRMMLDNDPREWARKILRR